MSRYVNVVWEDLDIDTWGRFQTFYNGPVFQKWKNHMESEVVGLMAEVGEAVVHSQPGSPLTGDAEAKLQKARRIKQALEVIDEYTRKAPRRGRIAS